MTLCRGNVIRKLQQFICNNRQNGVAENTRAWRITQNKRAIIDDSLSGKRDSNTRPPVPQTVALPGCAIPRMLPCNTSLQKRVQR